MLNEVSETNQSFKVVTVEGSQAGQHLDVTNMLQVLDVMQGSWPLAHRGALYGAVIIACMEQLEGRAHVDDVRAAFIVAAKEAGILVGEGRTLQ